MFSSMWRLGDSHPLPRSSPTITILTCIRETRVYPSSKQEIRKAQRDRGGVLKEWEFKRRGFQDPLSFSGSNFVRRRDGTKMSALCTTDESDIISEAIRWKTAVANKGTTEASHLRSPYLGSRTCHEARTPPRDLHPHLLWA